MKPLTLVLLAAFWVFAAPANATEALKVSHYSHPAPIVSADGSYAVLAKDAKGTVIDKRTDRPASAAQIAEAKQADRWNGDVRDVTLWKSDPEAYKKADGLNGYGFKNGRRQTEGAYGKAHVDVLRGEASANAEIGLRSGKAAAEAKFVVAEVGAETNASFGDPNGLNNATAEASIKASVGAEAKADLGYVVDGKGAAGNGGFSAHVGGRMEGEIKGAATICGVQVGSSTKGFVSYGAGIEARGHFAFDWTEMKFKMGGHASATLGLGAGLGTNVEISLKKVLEDPRAAGHCMADNFRKGVALQVEPLAKGARHVWGALGSLRRRAIDGVVAFNEAARAARQRLEADPSLGTTGVNVGRFSDTRPLAVPAVAQRRSMGRPAGGGQTR